MEDIGKYCQSGTDRSDLFMPKFSLEVTELGVEKILCLSCILWFKNGIIFAYRWRGESRAVAACLEHARRILREVNLG